MQFLLTMPACQPAIKTSKAWRKSKTLGNNLLEGFWFQVKNLPFHATQELSRKMLTLLRYHLTKGVLGLVMDSTLFVETWKKSDFYWWLWQQNSPQTLFVELWTSTHIKKCFGLSYDNHKNSKKAK